MVDDSKELAGLPATSVAVAKSEAEKRGLGMKASGYSLSHAPSRLTPPYPGGGGGGGGKQYADSALTA